MITTSNLGLDISFLHKNRNKNKFQSIGIHHFETLRIIDIFIDTYEIPSTNLTLPLLKKNYLKYCDISVRYVYATCHISVFMTLKEFF